MDLLIGENLFFVKVANMDLIYRPLSRMGGDRGRGYVGVLFLLSILEYHLEYMKIWCNIQVILIRLVQTKLLL